MEKKLKTRVINEKIHKKMVLAAFNEYFFDLNKIIKYNQDPNKKVKKILVAF